MSARRTAKLALVAAATLAALGGGCDRSTPMGPRQCEDACAAGATACDAAGARLRCLEPASPELCRAWSAAERCGGRRTCVAGACACLSPCPAGASVCATDAAEQRCVGPDADGCFAWDEPRACAAGVPCVGGSCGCGSPCQLGATACGPGGERLTCAGPDASGCSSWLPAPCAARQVCLAGACVCENPCVANQVQCEGLVAALVRCAAPDENGCTAWGAPELCAAAEMCQDDVGPGHVPACVTYTPPPCQDVNECDFVGQQQCMSDSQYRECFIRPEDGCLRLDCFS